MLHGLSHNSFFLFLRSHENLFIISFNFAPNSKYYYYKILFIYNTFDGLITFYSLELYAHPYHFVSQYLIHKLKLFYINLYLQIIYFLFKLGYLDLKKNWVLSSLSLFNV